MRPAGAAGTRPVPSGGRGPGAGAGGSADPAAVGVAADTAPTIGLASALGWASAAPELEPCRATGTAVGLSRPAPEVGDGVARAVGPGGGVGPEPYRGRRAPGW